MIDAGEINDLFRLCASNFIQFLKNLIIRGDKRKCDFSMCAEYF